MTNFKEIEPLLREAAKQNFVAFCFYYDYEFFSSRPFLKQIAQAFQEIADGKIKTLSVSLPPRAGKSYITTLFCAWLLGRYPTESVMRNTCTATLSRKLSRDARDVIFKERFTDVFPEVRLSKDNASVDGWSLETSKNVGYFGQGVGGTIIGFGASKVAITDDLFRSMEDALSETIRDKVHSWKQGTHDSRLEKGCASIDIGTRWVRDDVIGANSEKGYYDKEIIVPALDENDQSYCEAVMSTEEYHKKREDMTKEIWMAEYMQQPIDIEGRVFENLKTFDYSEVETIKQRSEGKLAYIDVADEGLDYTAMAVGHLVGNEVFITDLLFTRDNTDITIPRCVGVLNDESINYCAIEVNSMGGVFLKEVRKLVRSTTIQGVRNQTNKNTRILMNSGMIINRFNFVKDHPDREYRDFIANMESYSKEGKNKNDDAPDCLAGLCMFFRSRFSRIF